MAPGLKILNVRVTKPRIPDVIFKNYELMEAEKTQLLISIEHQRVVEKNAETERKKAVIEAEKQAQISKIQYEQKIMEKESVQRMELIENKIQSDRYRSQADNELYIAQQQVNINFLNETAVVFLNFSFSFCSGHSQSGFAYTSVSGTEKVRGDCCKQ